MKIFQTGSALAFFLSISFPVFSQDVIYKKDSVVLRAEIIEFSGNTLIFKLPGESKTFYLSKSVLDSLRYGNGRSVDLSIKENQPEKRLISRNYFNTELVNLLSGKINIDYERMSETGRTGFTGGLLINTNNGLDNYWDEYHGILNYFSFSPHYFFIKIGINFYPFNYSLVRTKNSRFSTGFSLLTGSYRKIDFNNYDYSIRTKPVFATDLMWNMRERLFIGEHLQINGGLEISMLPFFTFFCPQLGLSIGF
jgi:DNA-dependent RNA polymerase auxiliary subunit epsilon